ncbi:KIP1-like protein, partial [Musa troglodytarum]
TIVKMKRAAPWEKSLVISSDDSSDSDSEDDGLATKMSRKYVALDSKKKTHGGMNFDALSKHGYRGGPSVLKVPPPRVEDKEQDWSWSTGKGPDASKSITEESFEERERTRAAVAQGEKLSSVRTNLEASRKEKNLSFSQKEKRKRDLGQASRGKNYVEEEKRLLPQKTLVYGAWSGRRRWVEGEREEQLGLFITAASGSRIRISSPVQAKTLELSGSIVQFVHKVDRYTEYKPPKFISALVSV